MAVQVFVAACGLSVAVASGGRSGAAPASHCRLLTAGFSVLGTWAQLPHGLLALPGMGTEPMCLALAG